MPRNHTNLGNRHEANAFHDASTWSSARVIDNLPQFLREQGGKSDLSLSLAPKAMGSPHTIVVTSAGIRAADITR
jgi:protein CMS1